MKPLPRSSCFRVAILVLSVLLAATMRPENLAGTTGCPDPPVTPHVLHGFKAGLTLNLKVDADGSHGLNNPLAPAFHLTGDNRTNYVDGMRQWHNSPGTGISINDNEAGANWLVSTAWPVATFTITYNGQQITRTCDGTEDPLAYAKSCEIAEPGDALTFIGMITIINTNGQRQAGVPLWKTTDADFGVGMFNNAGHEAGHGFGLWHAAGPGNVMSLAGWTNGRISQYNSAQAKAPVSPCDKMAVQTNPRARYDRTCLSPFGVPPRPGDAGCACNAGTNRWDCHCLVEDEPQCLPGDSPHCPGPEGWTCWGPGPECDGGDCGGTCTQMFSSCGPTPPPTPGPTCSPSLEFLGDTIWGDCVDICTDQVSDSFNSCTGMWRSEACAYRWGPNSCGVTSSRILGWHQEDNGSGGSVWVPIAMQPHSAVRQCAGWSWWSPTYMQTSLECLQHCDANGADACEWEASTGDCYVEFGSGCQVEYGYYGWSAYVLNSGGGGSGGSGGSGTMFQNNAVSCSDWSWWSPVYKADAEECGSHCQANNADACEWEAGTGDCYVEFGNNCSLFGHGGWWAAVYNDEAATAGVMSSIADAFNRHGQRLLDLRVLAALIVGWSIVAVVGLVAVFRRHLLIPETMAG